MSDAGYTLAEMLAALMVIGLAFGGLAQGAAVVGRMQGGATRTVHQAAASADLARALDDVAGSSGPFVSDGRGAFAGVPDAFGFDCADGARCGASLASASDGAWLTLARGLQQKRLRLPAGGSAHFVYVDDVGSSSRWPVAGGTPRMLRSISLEVGSGANEVLLAQTRLWIEEPPQCVFDSVAQGCRAAP